MRHKNGLLFVFLIPLLVALAVGLSSARAQNVITTIAGTDFIFPRQVRALEAPLDKVICVATDARGNVYVCDAQNHIVARVSRDGTLAVVAGNGVRPGGFAGDGGSAINAWFNTPTGVVLDAAGNLYISDNANHRVRKVSVDGTIGAVAGTGEPGFSGDAGPATGAKINFPNGLDVDAAGNLYFADTGNNRVRKVSPDGTISTVAGNGTAGFSGDGGPATNATLNGPGGLALDSAGTLYVADSANGRVRKVSPQGTISTVISGLSSPTDVAVDASGNLYIAEQNRNLIRKVDAAGTVTTVAGGGDAFGDGGPATNASLAKPGQVAVDAAGNLYIADNDNRRIRKVSPLGTITTYAGSGQPALAGDGGAAAAASLSGPMAIAFDGTGNLYIADSGNNRVRKIDSAGIITSVAGGGTILGDGGPATSANLNQPLALAFDAAGNLYITDPGNCRVRKVTPQGAISTYAGSACWFSGGDGGPATSAALNWPMGIAFDAAGNLYIAEQGWAAWAIRKVDTKGIISRPVVDLTSPEAVAVDGAGNVYIADTGAHRIRKLSSTGTLTTFAGTGSAGFSGDGGPVTNASLNLPSGLFFDSANNLYIAERGNHRIRKVTPGGIISTVAGNGNAAFTGDGGPRISAALNGARGVVLDAAGNLYIADTDNNRIRAIPTRLATFSVKPSRLDFSAAAGAGPPAAQPIGLISSVPGVAWETSAVITSSGGNWLSVSASSGLMPAIISVSVDTTNLSAGTYQGTIEISAPAASPSTASISVTLTVTGTQPPGLSVQPPGLDFRMLAGAAAPPAQSLRIENTGGGSLSWTAEAAAIGGNWLVISSTSGTAPATLQVSVNPAGLASGSYSGSVTVRSTTTNQSATIRATLLISASSGGVLLLSQASLAFRAVEGGGAEPPQTFGVLNIGGGLLDWTAQASESWLRLSPSSGRSDAASAQIPLVTVSVEPAGLAPGFYLGLVRVAASAANNSPQVVRVEMQVLPRGTKLGAVVRPTGLIFVAAAGGANPGSQEISVGTPETSPIQFVSQPIGGAWVTRFPESGSATRDNSGRIIVQPRPGNLQAGAYRAGLTVLTTNDGELHPVNLLLLVLPAGTVVPASGAALGDAPFDGAATACTPSKLFVQFTSVFSRFNAVVDWPTALRVEARDDCGSPAIGGTVMLSFSSGEPALALVDLKNGQYHGAWRPSAANPQVVLTARALWRGLQGQATAAGQVSLNPNPKAVALSQGGVLLGAGFERGPVAPGSIISLFGQNLASGVGIAGSLPLPRKIGGVRVLVGEKEAPLFYVGPGQVNAQAPFELEADRQLQVRVETNGVTSAPEPFQTAGARPGIFTLGPPYGNQGAILIANTDRLAMPVTANVPSGPTQVGGIVSIYCTGLGATDPAARSGEAGSAEPLAVVKTPVTVSIGGRPAEVSFAGLAPGFVGVYQVNARVPTGVTPGDAVPVVITQGGFASNTATIAVK